MKMMYTFSLRPTLVLEENVPLMRQEKSGERLKKSFTLLPSDRTSYFWLLMDKQSSNWPNLKNTKSENSSAEDGMLLKFQERKTMFFSLLIPAIWKFVMEEE
jgi:hypothetical protein